MSTLVVHKGRTNVIPVSLGIDVSQSTITSEVRTPAGVLIMTWDVAFTTDGANGELILTVDDSVTADITYPTGLMDIKRVTGGEPMNVFAMPLEVEFRETVTV